MFAIGAVVRGLSLLRKPPDQLWGSTILLFNRYRVLFWR